MAVWVDHAIQTNSPSHFAYYNLKIHTTLKTTPAMAAGITTKLWEIEDLLALLEG
jgi:hypothetical protein